jgi:transcriptional regulator with XRE-family HTH domain
MGIVGDSLDRAGEAGFTRPVPRTARGQMQFLVRTLRGTRAVAALLGVSQRTVERYVKGQLRTPRPELATRLADETRRRWQPRVRERARRRAATSTGITIETRARFGFTAAPGSTDDARVRLVTQHLPPRYADRLFTARADGAPEETLRAIAAEALRDVYFQDNGRRATGLDVEFTDIDYVELDY